MCSRLPKFLMSKVLENLEFKDIYRFFMISMSCSNLRQSEDLWRRVFESKFGAVVSETKPPQFNFVGWFLTLVKDKMFVRPPGWVGDEMLVNSLSDLLLYACKNGYIELVIYTLKNKVDIHYKNDRALGLASVTGRTEIVNLLIANGANVQANDNYALRHAAENGHGEIVKLLIANGANVQAKKNYALIFAAQNGHNEIVKLLIDKGANVKAWDNYALILAAIDGNTEIVKLLIANGADVQAVDNYVLKNIAENGHHEIVEILRDSESRVIR